MLLITNFSLGAQINEGDKALFYAQLNQWFCLEIHSLYGGVSWNRTFGWYHFVGYPINLPKYMFV